MKKSVIAVIALSLMLMAANASANVIGIFGDTEGNLCTADASIQYTNTVVYFLAVLTDVPAITAAEFGALNVNLAGTIPTVAWNTGLVIGDILTPEGVALAFSPALPGPIVNMGSITYFLLAPQPPDFLLEIVESEAGVLAVVDDNFVTFPADGWNLVLNCQVGGPYGACECLDNIPTEDASWGAVKSLY